MDAPLTAEIATILKNSRIAREVPAICRTVQVAIGVFAIEQGISYTQAEEVALIFAKAQGPNTLEDYPEIGKRFGKLVALLLKEKRNEVPCYS